MNKETHSLHNFAALQSGGSYSNIFSLLRTWLSIQKEQIWKWHCLRKMALESKKPSSKSLILVSFCWKRMFYSLMHSLTWFSPHDFFESSDQKCCILFGPTCIGFKIEQVFITFNVMQNKMRFRFLHARDL